MRRRIIAVLLSLSVGVAAMPMPVMAEGGSEVVLEAVVEEPVSEAGAPEVEAEAVEEAAPEAEVVPEAPVEAAPEVEAPVEEAAAPEEEVIAGDELLIIDEEAEVAEPGTEAVTEAETEEELVVEETEEAAETETELADAAKDVEGARLTVFVGKSWNKTHDQISKDINKPDTITGLDLTYDPGRTSAYLPAIKLEYTTDPVTEKKIELHNGIDYDVTVVKGNGYSANQDHTIKIHFKNTGDYKMLADIYLKYHIDPLDLSDPKYDAKVVYDQSKLAKIYVGHKIYPDVKVYFTYNGKEYELKAEDDYTAVPAAGNVPANTLVGRYQNNNLIDVGIHEMVIQGRGSYVGVISSYGTEKNNPTRTFIEYVIKQRRVEAQEGDIAFGVKEPFYLDDQEYTADGIESILKGTVRDTLKNEILDPNEYTVEYYVVEGDSQRPIDAGAIYHPGKYAYKITTTGLRKSDETLWYDENGVVITDKIIQDLLSAGGDLTEDRAYSTYINNRSLWMIHNRPLSNFAKGITLKGTFEVKVHQSMSDVFGDIEDGNSTLGNTGTAPWYTPGMTLEEAIEALDDGYELTLPADEKQRIGYPYPVKKVTKGGAQFGEIQGLEYEGLDYFERVRERILAMFNAAGQPGFNYGANVNVSVAGGAMKDVGEYTITISGASQGPWEGESDITLTVRITPRELSYNANGPTTANGKYTVGGGTHLRNQIICPYVYQERHSDGTYEEPRLVLFDNGNGSHGKQLVAGTDYEYWFECDPTTNKATTLYITGINNYQTTAMNPPQGVAPGLVTSQEIMIDLTKVPEGPQGEVSNTVPLDASFITAKVDEKKDLNWKSYNQPIEFSESEIIVTEHYSNGRDVRIDPEDYIIIGYDGNKLLGKPMSKTAPYTAGKHTVWIEGKPGTPYEGTTRSVSYTIEGVPFESKHQFAQVLFESDPEALVEIAAPMPKVVNVAAPGVVLDAAAIQCEYFDKDGNEVLGGPFKKDDPIRFPHAGEYTVKVYANQDNIDDRMAQFSGYIEGKFTVKPRAISNPQITVNATQNNPVVVEWDGKTVTPEDLVNARNNNLTGAPLTVTDGGTVKKHGLVLGTDYTLEFDGNKIGRQKLTIKGKGDYDGLRADAYVQINQRSLMRATVEVTSVHDQPYAGGDPVPLTSKDVVVKYRVGAEPLAEKSWKTVDPSEYTVVPDPSKTKVGDTAQVKIQLKTVQEGGHFKDAPRTALAAVRIVQADLGDTSIFAIEGVADKKYTGSAVMTKEDVVVKDKRTVKAVNPDEYDVEFIPNAEDVGTVIVTVTGKSGNYKGTQTTKFQIQKLALKSVEIAPKELVYTGSVLKPETVTVLDENGAVVPADQYTVAFQEDAVNVGTYKVSVSAAASGKYEGEVAAEFEITKAANELSALVSPTSIKVGEKAKVAVTGFGDMKYTSGNTGIVTVAADGTVTGVASGKTTITVATEGDKNHYGATATVNITVKTVGKVTASGVSKVFKTKKQSFTLSASALGNVPVTFQSDSKNITVNATTGKVTVKAGYVGTAKITITAAETADYTKATKTVTVKIVPKATTLKSVTSKNGKITAKWAMKKVATCYQLQYATDKNFTKGKAKVWSKSETASSKTIKKTFEKGKTYYVRIRTCTRTDKYELLYSAWSAAKKVTIK